MFLQIVYAHYNDNGGAQNIQSWLPLPSCSYGHVFVAGVNGDQPLKGLALVFRLANQGLARVFDSSFDVRHVTRRKPHTCETFDITHLCPSANAAKTNEYLLPLHGANTSKLFVPRTSLIVLHTVCRRMSLTKDLLIHLQFGQSIIAGHGRIEAPFDNKEKIQSLD